MSEGFIPLSVPNFSGNEKQYVSEAVVSEWVSTGGSMVSGFEEKLAAYVGMPRAVACNSGTSGLHLALLAAGVKPGDEVLAPTLTFIAAVNPIRYCGAEPVFLGCDDSLCLDPALLEAFCEKECVLKEDGLYRRQSGKRVAAVVAVHVFGNLADMPRIMAAAQKYRLKVIEDATEALGTRYTEGPYQGRFAGTIGDAGAYSFNGNKIITTGAGGMTVSLHPDWAERMKYLSTQAKDDLLQFLHGDVGYNYRMTNLQAALGLAQLEQLEGFIAHKHALYDFYRERLDGKKGIKMLGFRPGTRPNKWFFSLYLEDYPLERDALIEALSKKQIQTRPIWALIHEQKPYRKNEAFGVEKAADYRARIVNIPCSTNLSFEDAGRVAAAIIELAE